MTEADPQGVSHRQQYDFMKMNQPETAKNVFVYLNGDQHFRGRKFVVNRRHVPDFNGFLNEVTLGIKAPFGAIRNIYTPTSGHRVETLDQLRSGMQVVAGGVERFRKLDYKEIGAKTRPKPQRNYLNIKIHNRMNVAARWRKYVKDPCQIYVYGNGDMINPAIRLLLIPRRMKTWDLILEEITEKISHRTGRAVRKLYDLDYRLLGDPSELENGQYYVAVGSEKLKKLPYGEIPKQQLSPRRGPHVPLPPIKGGTKGKTAGHEDTDRSYTKMYTQKKQLKPQPQEEHILMKATAATGYRPLKAKLSKPPKPLEATPTQEAESVFLAKPVRVKRSGGHGVPAPINPYDAHLPHEDTDGVYRSKIRHIKAAEVDEDEDVKVDLPIDQIPADEVEEETIPVQASYEEAQPDIRKESHREASLSGEERDGEDLHRPSQSHLLDAIVSEDRNQSGDERTLTDEAEAYVPEEVVDPSKQTVSTFDDVAETAEPLSLPPSQANSAVESEHEDASSVPRRSIASPSLERPIDPPASRAPKPSIVSRKSNASQSAMKNASAVGRKSSDAAASKRPDGSKTSKASIVSRKSNASQSAMEDVSSVGRKSSVASAPKSPDGSKTSKASIVSRKSNASQSTMKGASSFAADPKNLDGSKTSKVSIVSRKSNASQSAMEDASTVGRKSSVDAASKRSDGSKTSKASIVSRKSNASPSAMEDVSSVGRKSSVAAAPKSPDGSKTPKTSILSRKSNTSQSAMEDANFVGRRPIVSPAPKSPDGSSASETPKASIESRKSNASQSAMENASAVKRESSVPPAPETPVGSNASISKASIVSRKSGLKDVSSVERKPSVPHPPKSPDGSDASTSKAPVVSRKSNASQSAVKDVDSLARKSDAAPASEFPDHSPEKSLRDSDVSRKSEALLLEDTSVKSRKSIASSVENPTASETDASLTSRKSSAAQTPKSPVKSVENISEQSIDQFYSERCSLDSTAAKNLEESDHSDASVVLPDGEEATENTALAITPVETGRFSTPGEMAALEYDKIGDVVEDGITGVSITDVTVSSISSLKYEDVPYDKITEEDHSKSLDQVNLEMPIKESATPSISLYRTESQENSETENRAASGVKTPYTLLESDSASPEIFEENKPLLSEVNNSGDAIKLQRGASTSIEDSLLGNLSQNQYSDQNGELTTRPSTDALTFDDTSTETDSSAVKHRVVNGSAVGAVSP